MSRTIPGSERTQRRWRALPTIAVLFVLGMCRPACATSTFTNHGGLAFGVEINPTNIEPGNQVGALVLVSNALDVKRSLVSHVWHPGPAEGRFRVTEIPSRRTFPCATPIDELEPDDYHVLDLLPHQCSQTYVALRKACALTNSGTYSLEITSEFTPLDPPGQPFTLTTPPVVILISTEPRIDPPPLWSQAGAAWVFTNGDGLALGLGISSTDGVAGGVVFGALVLSNECDTSRLVAAQSWSPLVSCSNLQVTEISSGRAIRPSLSASGPGVQGPHIEEIPPHGRWPLAISLPSAFAITSTGKYEIRGFGEFRSVSPPGPALTLTTPPITLVLSTTRYTSIDPPHWWLEEDADGTDHLRRPDAMCMSWFEQIGERWAVGETNLALVRIQWFPGLHCVESSLVARSGKVRNDWARTMSAGLGPSSGSLDAAGLETLKELINDLPASAPGHIPVSRRIQVSGTRSNTWYAFVYDRTNIPVDVERICDITGERIEPVTNTATSTAPASPR